MTRLTKSDLLQIGVDLANGDHVKSSVWARLLAQHNAALDVVEAARAMRIGDDDCLRCPWCGWPIRESAELGCVVGNCSMRPMPNDTDEARRAAGFDMALSRFDAGSRP